MFAVWIPSLVRSGGNQYVFDIQLWGGFSGGEDYDAGSFFIFHEQGKWGIQLFGPGQVTPRLNVDSLANAVITAQRFFKKVPLFTQGTLNREGVMTKFRQAGFSMNDPDPDAREISGGTGEKNSSGYYAATPFALFQRGEYYLVMVRESLPFQVYKITTSLTEAIDTVIKYYSEPVNHE